LRQSQAEPAYIRLNSKAIEEGTRWLTENGFNRHDFLAAIHPGAGSLQKRWPMERFIQLGQELSCQEALKLLIIEGPAEPGLAERIAGEMPDGRVILAESVPLGILGAALKRCGVFVGSDSGIAHLAAALKVPSVVLFGPTLPRHWAPLGPHVVALRDSGGCNCCTSEGKSHACLDNIAVGEVLRNIIGISRQTLMDGRPAFLPRQG
jgi:ADP-heptose:LPS heptosyltransferase